MLSKEECISNSKDELIKEYPFLSNEEAGESIRELYEFVEWYFFNE